MCCARSCAPGYADLALTIPAGQEEPSASPHADAFRKARQQHPVPARDWQFNARHSQPNTIVLTARPTKPGAPLPKNPQFFSADNLICSHPPQPWQKRDGTYEVALTLSEMPPKDQRSLRGVLTASHGWLGKGSARAITIDIPISP
jgi:DsbC/DsbD-like thiol-disulfide interchange protein